MTNSSLQRCRKLADAIQSYLKAGLLVEEDVRQFMASTFPGMTLRNLADQIQEEPDADMAPLVELVFYPTLGFQMTLEPLLEKETYHPDDEKRVVDLLMASAPSTVLSIPNGSSQEFVTLPKTILESIVSRLNISGDLPKEVIDAIHVGIPQAHQNRIKVFIRNRSSQTRPETLFPLIQFLRKGYKSEALFFGRFDMVLRLVCEKNTAVDFLGLLKERRETYRRCYQEAVKFDQQLKRYNMETLMSQGIRPPTITREEAEKKISVINDIIEIMADREES